MKFFSKLYFSMLVLIILALAVTEYFIVALSLDSAVDTQLKSALDNHQLVKYAIQSDILSAAQSSTGEISDITLKRISASASESMGVPLALFEYPSGKPVIDNIKITMPEFVSAHC